jgi:hypothetical protein
MSGVGSSTDNDAIKDFTNWLVKQGLYNNLCGWITRTQFNNGTANPIAIGGLAIPPSTTANSGIIVSSTGYWGNVWTAGPVPLALTGTGPKTLVSVTSFGSATGFSDICKLGNGGGGVSLTGCMGLFKQNGTGTQIEAIAPYGGGTQVYSNDLQLAPSGPFVSGSAVFYGDVFNGTTQSLSYISGTTTGSISASSAPPNVASGSVFNWQTDVSGAGTATYSITLYWPVALTTSQLQALCDEIAKTVGNNLGLKPTYIGPTVTGTFVGDGSGLTNLPAPTAASLVGVSGTGLTGIPIVDGTASAAINFGIVASGFSSTQAVACPGAALGDNVVVGLPADGGMGIQRAWVSTTGTLSVNSFAAIALTSTSQTYNFIVLKHP